MHTLSALTLLRRHRPLAHITWIVEDRFAGLLEGHPHIDGLITIPRAIWGRSLGNPLRWGGLAPEMMDLALGLRRCRFDVSIDFQSSIKSGWLVAGARASLRIGFAPPVSRELTHLVQNRLVCVPARGCHRIERDLALLAPLGIPTEFEDAVLPRSREFTEPVERLCAGLPRPLVVMHPGTSEFAAFKRWEPERYAEVAERLMDERGACVLVTWGPGEEALALRLVGATGHRATMAPRLTHLQQLTSVLDQADLFVGSDTGPMHVASALGRPVVALFGPKDPVETGPYGGRSEVVTAPVHCRPCTKRRCADPRCMLGIAVESVHAAAVRLLDGGGEVRARGGIIRKPFSTGFELGRWRGEVSTGYSAPEFYRFVAGLAERPAQGGSTAADGGPQRVRAPVPGNADTLLVWRRGAPQGVPWRRRSLVQAWRTRNCWRSALRLLRAGLPARRPVCYLETGALLAREQLLIAEDVAGAVPLPEALRGAPDRKALIRSLARLVQRLHRACQYHEDLRAENVVVDESGDLLLEGLGRAWCLPWRIPFVWEVLAGREVRRLLGSLEGMLSADETGELVRTYRRGMAPDPLRRRLLRWAIGPLGREGGGA